MNDNSPLREYLAVVGRRKWFVVVVLVLVTAGAVAFSLRQAPRYQASAEVLLSRQNLVATLNNVTDQSLLGDPARLAQTQADLAQVPPVARRVLARAKIKNLTPGQFLATSSVTAKSDADLLVFTVQSRHASVATLLATLYASAYISYRTDLDTAAVKRARRDVISRIAALDASGGRNSALYANLVDKEAQLATMQALQTSNATLIKPAQGAVQIAPRPVRNAVAGLALGLILGLGLAFLLEALDTRVRTSDGVAKLGLPILAYVPEPPRALRRSNRLAMLDEPQSVYAEPFRILRTQLELINLEHAAKTIMVTSALEAEGKSTTIANLAVAAARGGRNVILADLDFRNPRLRSFFPPSGPQGLTEVALAHFSLDEALVPVALGEAGRAYAASGNGNEVGNGAARPSGMLRLLHTGTLPPNPGEFIGSAAVGRVLADLSARADLVFLDSAPLLGIGDALTLAAEVDALILVTRLNVLRRPTLRELERALGGCRARPLGVVVTGAQNESTYGNGYRYGSSGSGKEHVASDIKDVVAHDREL